MKNNYLDFSELNREKGWLPDFILSDSTIGEHPGRTVIRLYNKDTNLLHSIVEYFNLPNKVTKQVNKTTTVYFIRFSDKDIVSAIQSLSFGKDRTNLRSYRVRGDLSCKSAY